jgi:hypothetical protein
MFINVNVCFLVSIETHKLAANLEGMALRISRIPWPYAHGNRGWVLTHGNFFFPHINYRNVGTIEIYLVGEIKQGHGQAKY